MQNQKLTTSQRILIIISSLSIASIAASDLLTYKLFQFNSIVGSASLFVFPLTYLLSDIITELYSKVMARFLLYVTLVSEGLFDIGLSFIIKLPSPSTFNHQGAYDQVLGSLGRVYWGVIIAFLISAIINIQLMAFLKSKLSAELYVIRSFISTMIGLLLFTIIGYFIWFYKVESIGSIIELIGVSLVSKIVVVIIMLVPISVLIKYLKRKMEH